MRNTETDIDDLSLAPKAPADMTRQFTPMGMNATECPKCGAAPWSCTKHYPTTPRPDSRKPRATTNWRPDA